jgi:FtsP/CotA-like multicopper oxidase with cupredoxin domain
VPARCRFYVRGMHVKHLVTARPTYAGVTLYTAALLTLGAAAIHLVVAPPHLREYLPFGLFFFAVACAQAVSAVQLMVRPSRRLALLMAAGAAGLVGLWLVSRTVGLPIGPTPGAPEEVGVTDVICSLLESVSVVLLLALGVRRPRRRVRRVWLAMAAALPSALLVSGMTATAVAAALTAMPEAVNAAPPVPGRSAVSVADLTQAPGTEPVDHFTLTAQVSRIDGQTLWTYNGTVPGPELRVTQGDRVQVTLVNQLPDATTIHWHGVRLPNAEDGAAGVTQDAVRPGQSFTYEFVARDVGTYWYHSHQQTEAQLPRGLFGALIVEPAQPTEDRDITVLLHGDPGHVRVDPARIDALPGQTVRLRVINAVVGGMDGGPETPVVLGAPFVVAALDGHELHDPQPLSATRVPLGMGQRADLVFTMPPTNSVTLRLAEVQGASSPVQKVFETLQAQAPPSQSLVIGDGPPPEQADLATTPLFDMTSYGTPAPELEGPFDVTAPIVLSEKPGLRDGRPQLIHLLNGEAAPNVPPLQVTEGQTVQLHIVNDTDEYHPMHIHGHVFTLLARNGQPLTGSPVQLDSVLVGPHETYDVAFVADNPGVWMLHCHVLLHAGMGMMMTMNYTGVYTPYEMGTASGNMPE